MKRKLDCIMLIDDNEDDNFYHQIVIRDMEITNQIKIAESGLEALEMLTKENDAPELIFLDINMPAMNGWEFLDEYNKLSDEQKASVIIIMLTTSLNPADRNKAQKIPVVHGFETKPLTREKLRITIERYFPDNKK